MKISIITSCFNREATVGQAVESVLAQDWPDLGTGQGDVRGHQQGHPGRHGRRGGAAAQRRLPVFSAYGVPHRSRVREDRGGLRVRRRTVRRLPRHPAGGAQLDRREVQQVEGAPRVAAAAPHVLHPPRVHRKVRAV